MPRPNPGRTLKYEEFAAGNIARLRADRDLTYEALAAKMTGVGCPIQPSALFKIEKGTPPRKVTINELVAFGMVFGVPVVELLEDPGAEPSLEMGRILHRAEEAHRAVVAAQEDLDEAVREMREFVAQEPSRRTALRRFLDEWWGDWPEFRTHFRDALRRPRTTAEEKS